MNKTISLALVFSSCCFIPFNPLFLEIHAGHEDNLWGGAEIEKEKDDNSDLGVIHYCNYHNHFIENSSNFGNNADTQATCGYVSLAMLLNYYDSTNNYYYCRCGSIFHTTHTYTYPYEYQSSNYHRSYCVCGDFILEKHYYRINIHCTPCVCGGSVWD